MTEQGKRSAPQVGDVWRVECSPTDALKGALALVAVEVPVRAVDKMGCGCWRLLADRPGPRIPNGCLTMHILTGCGVHAADGTPVTKSRQPRPTT